MILLWWLLLMFFGQVFPEFYAGRIKPGKFEYPKLNGLMLVTDAQEKCENDLACAGFTFKGSYKTMKQAMQMYFFHFIPENNDLKYLYWSTYKVDRNFVKLHNITMNPHLKNSQIIGCSDAEENFHKQWLKNSSIVAIQRKQKVAYSKIDFADFITSKNSDDIIELNIEKTHMITQTLPKIDRCCKVNELNGRNIEYDGIDNMERIECDISKNDFVEKFVNKRQSVIMVGCQESWKAKHWTIENLLDKYNGSLIWETVYQKNVETVKIKEYLQSNEVKNLIDSGFFVKIFHKLPKNWLIKEEVENKELLLELIEGYALPKPMPECEFQKYNMEGKGERYLMLATGGTGTKMHIDPEYTDAFNALISGSKWWVSLPRDLYEFRDEFSCDPQCSEPSDNFHRQTGAWFIHILPQIRDRIFYGQKLKSFLQKPGETVYMPNLVLHTVWNFYPSVSVGDNPLYQTSFDEWMGSGGVDGSPTSKLGKKRILQNAKGGTKLWLNNIIDQIDETVSKHKIADYKGPLIDNY